MKNGMRGGKTSEKVFPPRIPLFENFFALMRAAKLFASGLLENAGNDAEPRPVGEISLFWNGVVNEVEPRQNAMSFSFGKHFRAFPDLLSTDVAPARRRRGALGTARGSPGMKKARLEERAALPEMLAFPRRVELLLTG